VYYGKNQQLIKNFVESGSEAMLVGTVNAQHLQEAVYTLALKDETIVPENIRVVKKDKRVYLVNIAKLDMNPPPIHDDTKRMTLSDEEIYRLVGSGSQWKQKGK
jgi:hypothetical protein